MINRVINKIKSQIKYLKVRSENRKFPDKLRKNPVKISDNYVCSPEQILSIYPNMASNYPDKSIFESLKIKEKVKTAAVIFNSGLILEKEWGEEIDKNDIVIRINFIPTKGYEKHTGSKTTIRILGRNWIFREKDELMIHTYNNVDFYNKDVEIYKNSKRLAEEKCLFVFDNNSWQPIYEYFGANITNGLRAVIFALSLSEKVIIYGFDTTTQNWKQGKKLTHFPSEKDVAYVQQVMAPYNLIHQEYDKYFGPTSIKNGKVSTIHNSINKEYMFYEFHPNVSYAK